LFSSFIIYQQDPDGFLHPATTPHAVEAPSILPRNPEPDLHPRQADRCAKDPIAADEERKIKRKVEEGYTS
jgi:hypothetical protein